MALANSPKHIAFLKISVPKQEHNSGNKKAFFALECGGNILFHITQKPNISPERFKSAKKIKDFLDKKKFLTPELTRSIPAKGRLIVGTMHKRDDGKIALEITGKIGGGGKALLKGFPWNKLGVQKGNVILESAREEVDDKIDRLKGKDGNKAVALGKFTQKALELHIKIDAEKVWLDRTDAPDDEKLQKLEDLLRHLTKYKDKDCISHLNSKSGFFHPEVRIEKAKYAQFNLVAMTPSELDSLIGRCNTQITELEARVEAADTESGADIADEDVDAIDLDSIISLVTDVWLNGSSRTYQKIERKYPGILAMLWKDFSSNPEIVIELSRRIASGSIEALIEKEFKLRS